MIKWIMNNEDNNGQNVVRPPLWFAMDPESMEKHLTTVVRPYLPMGFSVSEAKPFLRPTRKKPNQCLPENNKGKKEK